MAKMIFGTNGSYNIYAMKKGTRVQSNLSKKWKLMKKRKMPLLLLLFFIRRRAQKTRKIMDSTVDVPKMQKSNSGEKSF